MTYDAVRPLPPHIQAELGVGGHVRERELGLRNHVTCYVIARPCHVTISSGEGGGTHCVIGHVTQASSVEGCTRSVYYYPMPGKGRKYHRNRHLPSVKRGSPSIALALGFCL